MVVLFCCYIVFPRSVSCGCVFLVGGFWCGFCVGVVSAVLVVCVVGVYWFGVCWWFVTIVLLSRVRLCVSGFCRGFVGVFCSVLLVFAVFWVCLVVLVLSCLWLGLV